MSRVISPLIGAGLDLCLPDGEQGLCARPTYGWTDEADLEKICDDRLEDRALWNHRQPGPAQPEPGHP